MSALTLASAYGAGAYYFTRAAFARRWHHVGRGLLRTHMLAVVRLFRSPTGDVIRELVAESQADPAVAVEFRDRFWKPRRILSAVCVRAGIERGQVREDLPVETTLDALYGVLWMRLLIGHRKLDRAIVDEVLDVMWPGMARSQGS